MVQNHVHLALDRGGGSGSRSGPNLHREVTFGVRRPGKLGILRATGILLIGVVVSMGEKNAAVQSLCTVSPPRKGAEAVGVVRMSRNVSSARGAGCRSSG
jgi:hypothetical protein